MREKGCTLKELTKCLRHTPILVGSVTKVEVVENTENALLLEFTADNAVVARRVYSKALINGFKED